MLYNQNKTIKIRLSEEVKITTLISFSQCTYRTVTQSKILRAGSAAPWRHACLAWARSLTNPQRGTKETKKQRKGKETNSPNPYCGGEARYMVPSNGHSTSACSLNGRLYTALPKVLHFLPPRDLSGHCHSWLCQPLKTLAAILLVCFLVLISLHPGLVLTSFVAEAGFEVKIFLLSFPSAEMSGVSSVSEVLPSCWTPPLVSPPWPILFWELFTLCTMVAVSVSLLR